MKWDIIKDDYQKKFNNQITPLKFQYRIQQENQEQMR